ncbi:M15 family metallopeptidase [Candidatus Peregrinibacteria bacterium]|jgi:hypothetical protein|nr:M15 family metallopeptidase [Candidatus Peregrinibacteria bacterium]
MSKYIQFLLFTLFLCSIFLPTSNLQAASLLYNKDEYILKDPYFSPLNKDYIPYDLRDFKDYGIKTVKDTNPLEQKGRETIMKPLKELISLCEKESNMEVYIRSGYRSYSLQQSTYKKYGKDLSARPGHSEHQLGLAIDIETHRNLSKEFMNKKNPVYLCFKAHGVEYGFVQSYTYGNPYGYESEPWHWRYIGVRAGEWLERNASLESPWKVFESDVVAKLQLSDTERKRILKMKSRLYKSGTKTKKERIERARELIKKRVKVSSLR